MKLFTKKKIPNTDEMNSFYRQLIKMKNKRKNFNVEKVIKKVYPNFIFPNEK
jgi:hypothetical protein